MKCLFVGVMLHIGDSVVITLLLFSLLCCWVVVMIRAFGLVMVNVAAPDLQ